MHHTSHSSRCHFLSLSLILFFLCPVQPETDYSLIFNGREMGEWKKWMETTGATVWWNDGLLFTVIWNSNLVTGEKMKENCLSFRFFYSLSRNEEKKSWPTFMKCSRPKFQRNTQFYCCFQSNRIDCGFLYESNWFRFFQSI